MSEEAEKTPLIELLADVPEDLRAEWPCQFFEDGTPSGHTMSPIGRHVKEAVELIQSLQKDLEDYKNELCNACNRAAYNAEKADDLQSQLTEANARADYWKANGNAHATENERLSAEVEELKAQAEASAIYHEGTDAMIQELEAQLTKSNGFLGRYYREIPKGHQPHMIVHEVAEFLFPTTDTPTTSEGE